LVSVLPCCHLSMAAVISTVFCIYWQLLQSDGRHCEVADCLGSDSTMRNYVVQLGDPICRTAVLWCHLGLDDLPFLLSNSTFHDFNLCCGSTWILFKAYSKGFP
jgi:hypothetical protein